MSVHYETSKGIARFTLDNGKLNLLNVSMYEQLCTYFSQFMADDSAKVAIIMGSNGNSFCAGDDLKSKPRPLHSTPHWPTILATQPRNKPVIAAVDGWCLGAGFQVLMSQSDIRIATADAKFGFPEINYGMGGAGGAVRLGRHLPHTVAMYMLMTGEYMSAKQARRYDLINQIVAPEKLLQRAEEIAAKIIKHPLLAIQVEMDAYTRGNDLSASDAMSLTSTLYRMEQALVSKEGVGLDDIEFRGNQAMDEFTDE